MDRDRRHQIHALNIGTVLATGVLRRVAEMLAAVEHHDRRPLQLRHVEPVAHRIRHALDRGADHNQTRQDVFALIQLTQPWHEQKNAQQQNRDEAEPA